MTIPQVLMPKSKMLPSPASLAKVKLVLRSRECCRGSVKMSMPTKCSVYTRGEEPNAFTRNWTLHDLPPPEVCPRRHKLGLAVVSNCMCPRCGEEVAEDSGIFACPTCAKDGPRWQDAWQCCSIQCYLKQKCEPNLPAASAASSSASYQK